MAVLLSKPAEHVPDEGLEVESCVDRDCRQQRASTFVGVSHHHAQNDQCRNRVRIGVMHRTERRRRGGDRQPAISHHTHQERLEQSTKVADATAILASRRLKPAARRVFAVVVVAGSFLQSATCASVRILSGVIKNPASENLLSVLKRSPT